MPQEGNKENDSRQVNTIKLRQTRFWINFIAQWFWGTLFRWGPLMNQKLVLIVFIVWVGGCKDDKKAKEVLVEETFTEVRYECPETSVGITCPLLPAPPQETFRPQTEDGVDFSKWIPPQCPSGSTPVFGGSGCKSIGTPCPDGLWPQNLVGTNLRYVTPNGTGDGSTPNSAAGQIQTTIDSAPSGTTIVLSKGTFNEAIELNDSHHVIGTCALETIISPPATQEMRTNVLINTKGGVNLRNFTVTGPNPGVKVYQAQNPVSIEGLIIDTAKQVGLAIIQGQATVKDVLVKNTQATSEGIYGIGIVAQDGAIVHLSGVMLDGNREFGMAVYDSGTLVSGQNIIINNTLLANGSMGVGLQLNLGPRVELERLLISRSHTSGVLITGGDSNLIANDLVVRDSESDSTHFYGSGIRMEAGGQATIKRAYFDNNRDKAIYVNGTNSSLDGEDVIVQTTRCVSDGSLGYGMVLSAGAKGVVQRALFSQNRDSAIVVSDSNTSLILEDCIVENSRANDNGEHGHGVSILDGASATFIRGRVDDNRNAGITINGLNTLFTGSDLVVQNTKVSSADRFASGVILSNGAESVLTRVHLTNNQVNGFTMGGTPEPRLTAEDLIIENTLDTPAH